MSVIRFADLKATPWKNGRGVTREIAVEPAGASMDDFLWRVSIADVDKASPFSTFTGIDRTIVLLEGDGFAMTLDDSRMHALTTVGEPFAFPGEARVDVALAGGATRDFNLMVRRGAVEGLAQAVAFDGVLELPDDTVLALLISGSAVIDGTALAPCDTWMGRGAMHAVEPGTLLLVRISRAVAPGPTLAH